MVQTVDCRGGCCSREEIGARELVVWSRVNPVEGRGTGEEVVVSRRVGGDKIIKKWGG
jgi:hypothetical protein